LKQLEYTNRWKRRKSALLSLRSIRKAEGTQTYKTYLRAFMMTVKEGR